jgi:phosphoribosylaminoimidazole-succinocarboxamide synthase
MSSDTLLQTSLPSLKLLSRGKVRDIYATSDPSALLFVATDRISAFDVVLRNVCVSLCELETVRLTRVTGSAR